MASEKSAPALSYFSSPHIDSLVCGFFSGSLSTLCLHPFDLIKTRLQVHRAGPAYKSSIDVLSHIVRSEGISSLYKGLAANFAGSSLAWGFYFYGYNSIKAALQEAKKDKKPLTSGDHLMAAAATGVLVQALTNPIWVVKTRSFLDEGRPLREQRGLVKNLWHIGRSEGISGLYRGFLPGLFGVSHGAVQFMVYEKLKEEILKKNRLEEEKMTGKKESKAFSTGEVIFMSITSKSIASVATYPYQVVRSRLQAADCRYSGALDCLKRTAQDEGIRGFYRGVLINTIKVMPAACLVFVAYEGSNNKLKQWAEERNKKENPT